MRQFFIIAILTLTAATAFGHPLGNFSVNQFSRIEVGKTRVAIHQVLDLAEIPTFQLARDIDRNGDGKYSQAEADQYAAGLTGQYLANIDLRINGDSIPLSPDSSLAVIGTGAGDLATLRFEWKFVSAFSAGTEPHRLTFENRNFADRLGWNEIVARGDDAVAIFDSTAFGSGISNELRSYPQDLVSPLDERTALLGFTSGPIPTGSDQLRDRGGQVAKTETPDRLAELISVPEMTPLVVVIGLLIAFGLGALHAMSPGHGKTVVGAYLVGSRGTVKHALFLGLTVTITHTLGVFALGLVTFFASNYVLSERLMPMLSFISGLLVFYIGVSMFKTRLSSALGWRSAAEHHHHHEHSNEHGDHIHDGHTHTHDGHTHSHLPPDAITWRSLLALGISGGLLPCPSALVLMLSAISLGRTGYGIILTIAFSFGLAATLTAVGLIFLYVGKAFGGSRLGELRIVKILPAFSAFVIACVGALICWDSFRG